jgi:hypothetical protein
MACSCCGREGDQPAFGVDDRSCCREGCARDSLAVVPHVTGFRFPRRGSRFANRRGLGSVVAVCVALMGVATVWISGWQGPDWPAQIYRAELFHAHGWLLWDSSWYGGHYVLPYSVLFPPLAATIGLYGAAAVSAAGSAWAFERLLRSGFGSLSVLPAVLFAIATVIPVLLGQLPFLAGEAAGLLALVAARRDRRLLAGLLAAACSLLSPVAGALLVLALIAWAITSPPGRRLATSALAAVAVLPLVVLGLSFPESGRFPFWGSDFTLILILCGLGVLVIPAEQRTLRAGLILYGAAAVVLFAVPNPLGGNYVRLASAVAPSLIVIASRTPKRRFVAVLAIPIVLWQWSPAFALINPASQDPAANAAYFTPLLTVLRQQALPGRVEIPFTLNHWETLFVAPHIPLARGWERQTDVADNPIFYDNHPLTPTSYRRWLDKMGVEWVALPDVALDYSSQREGELLKHPPAYLQPIWHNAHWRVWRVLGAPGLISGPGKLLTIKADHFVVDATKIGSITVRVRYTATWSVAAGHACLSASNDGWTKLTVSAPGRIQVTNSLVDHDTSCDTDTKP